MTDDILMDQNDLLGSVSPTSSPDLEKKIQKLIADDAAQQLRTEKYYKKLKAENLDNFLSPKIQKAMEADAQALGEKWFDGDE